MKKKVFNELLASIREAGRMLRSMKNHEGAKRKKQRKRARKATR
jgi:hypothetical protein